MAVSELVYLCLFLYVRLIFFVQIVVVSSFSFYNEVFMTDAVMLCREIQSWPDSGSTENWGHRIWKKEHRHRMIGDRAQAVTGDHMALRNTPMVG